MTLPDAPSEAFERQMLPHLAGAYRLAHWLLRDDAAAQDVVQDSYLKAFEAWGRYKDGNPRAWLLTIVRRQSLNHLRRAKGPGFVDIDDEDALTPADARALSHEATPERSLIDGQRLKALHAALAELPLVFREAILLKDIEDMPYKMIAEVLGVPVGTVMSRLSRGRDLLRLKLQEMPL